MGPSKDVIRRLKLQLLNVLIAVARTGSMAKAAKHLATSQSVVSKSVSELENILGVRLFDRSPQGVEPTLYGRALLKRSVAIFDDLRTSVGEIQFIADPGVGELRVGTTEPQAAMVAAVIERLSRQHPRLDFKVVVADSVTLFDRELRGRAIDLMIGPLQKPSAERDLEATFLYENRLRVVVSRRSKMARRRKVALADLINEPWCTAPLDLPSGAAFAGAFRASGLPLPRVVVSSVATHLCHRLLADGRFVGISFDGSLYFDTQTQSLKVLPIEIASPPFAISIITLKNRTISPAARLFADCACSITKPLAKDRAT
jgi:DNA-binding transcriptional LysR family regulator